MTSAILRQNIFSGAETRALALARLNPRRLSLWLHWLAGRLGVTPHTLWEAVSLLNFLAMVGLLYWVLFRLKNWSLPGFLRQRGDQIQARMRDAEAAHREAEIQFQAAQARLAGLDQECRALRDASERQAQAEYQRLLEAARQEADQVAARVRQEIGAAARSARQQLRQYAGELAVQLAEQQALRQLTPELDEAIVQQGLEELARRAPRA